MPSLSRAKRFRSFCFCPASGRASRQSSLINAPVSFFPSEVSNALNKARQLYERWSELINDSAGVTKEEIEWTTTELRNGLRSIEWDLEDLEETVGIVESNPRKFKFDDQEISNRRQFITETRDEVTLMKEHVADAGKPGAQSKRATVASLMNSGLNAVTAAASGESTKYSKLRNEVDSPSHMLSSPESSELNVDLGHHQSLLLRGQSDEQDLEKLKQSVGQLKEITSRVGRQTDEHRV